MSEQPFTAGPWVAGHFADDDHPCNCTHVLSDQYMGSIATVRHGSQDGDGYPPDEEARANLRLIAAAPAMYEALKLARAFAEAEVENREHAGGTMSDYINEAQEVVDAIDAAISQAEASKKEEGR